MIKLGIDFYNIKDKPDYKDITLRVVQIFGYGYGVQAHTSKMLMQAQILYYYLYFSFIITAYLLLAAYKRHSTFEIYFDIFNIIVSLMVIKSVHKFCAYLKGNSNILSYKILERDELKKAIRYNRSGTSGSLTA